MKTANGILTLIQEYAVDYHDGYYAKATANRLVKLRAAIEELHRDARRYKWIATYLEGSDETYDDALVGCNDLEGINGVVDAAMEKSS